MTYHVISQNEGEGAQLITREYSLYCQGRFISQATGEHTFYSKSNLSYGKACESAKSNALTRCCKDLGIASELWDPQVCVCMDAMILCVYRPVCKYKFVKSVHKSICVGYVGLHITVSVSVCVAGLCSNRGMRNTHPHICCICPRSMWQSGRSSIQRRSGVRT